MLGIWVIGLNTFHHSCGERPHCIKMPKWLLNHENLKSNILYLYLYLFFHLFQKFLFLKWMLLLCARLHFLLVTQWWSWSLLTWTSLLLCNWSPCLQSLFLLHPVFTPLPERYFWHMTQIMSPYLSVCLYGIYLPVDLIGMNS